MSSRDRRTPRVSSNMLGDNFINPVVSNAPLGWSAVIDTGATCVNNHSVDGGLTLESDGTSEGVTIYRPRSIQLDNKYFEMEISFQVDAADDQDFYFGLTDSTLSAPVTAWTTVSSDFLAVGVSDGDSTPQLAYDKDNSGPATDDFSGAVGELVSGTDTIWKLIFDRSTSKVHAYQNGELAATASAPALIPDDLPLSPFFGFRTGGVDSNTATVNWFRYYIDSIR